MPAPKDDKSVKEDTRVIEKDDGSAYVPGVFVEGQQTGEDHDAGAAREDDDGEHEHEESANGAQGSDAELAQAETDEEREAIRARRRQERADKKRRAAERVETLERDLRAAQAQNAEIMQRMGAFERRASSTDLAQIDDAMRTVGANIEKLKGAISRGTKAGDGDLVANATAQLQQEYQRGNALNNAKQAYVQQEQQRTTTTTTQNTGPDPRIVANARAWASRNTWYDPAGATEESAIVRAIDQALSAEGRSPTDPGYFEELDRRIARRLPERSSGKMRGNAQGKPSGGARVAGSGSEATGSGGNSSKGYTLSPARVQALKEAGKWDDPAARAKSIEAYRKYDREHGQK